MNAPAPDWLRHVPIAHRGLHDARQGVVENSLAAFERAAAAGFAIELDLQVSADGEAMVFHDERLDRLTAESGLVCHRTAEALACLTLGGGPERMPTLRAALAAVAGRVPLLLEIKAQSREVGPLESRVAALIADYGGPCAVQSFNPWSVRWFARHIPHVPRGLLSARYERSGEPALSGPVRFALRHLLTAPMLKPHFIAYDIKALPALAPRIARSLGLPILAWTVRSEEERVRSLNYADNIIFEGFRPALR